MPTPGPVDQLWSDFCRAHQVADRAVPLFQANSDGRVQVEPFGTDERLILQRSEEMEKLIIRVVDTMTPGSTVYDPASEGMLYWMFWLYNGRPVPLYIGRAEKIGKNGGFSSNLAQIRSNRGKFARWGYNYAYHMGDLSAAVCPGHRPEKRNPKYVRWAERLFQTAPSDSPRLRQPVYFWATDWKPVSQSVWSQFQPCSLAFQEYLLIGVASRLYPDDILNTEGVARAGSRPG